MKMKSLPTVVILLALGVIVMAGYSVGLNPATNGGGSAAAVDARSEFPAHDSIRSQGSRFWGASNEQSGWESSDEPGPVATSTRAGALPVSSREIPKASLFNRELPTALDGQAIPPASLKRRDSSDRAAANRVESGSPGSPASEGGRDPQTGPGGTAAVAEPPRPLAPMPLVFRDLPPEVANDPQKMAVVQTLQQSFVNAIGGPNQDPTDPAYLEQWRAAQRMSDQQLQLRIGAQAFLAVQMAANHQ